MSELHQLEMHVAKLTTDIEHIRTDVADIKIDLRRIGGDAGAAGQRLCGKIDGLEWRLTDKIDAMGQRLAAKIDALRDEFASAKMWALGLYIAFAAGMLFAMAKGFKWI
jgi:outer membrane murein-binding lipoprotein Lpp